MARGPRETPNPSIHYPQSPRGTVRGRAETKEESNWTQLGLGPHASHSKLGSAGLSLWALFSPNLCSSCALGSFMQGQGEGISLGQ